MNSNFSSHIVQWQKTHGRNDLPWQNTRDPYRVWLSEIMLQQTQVSTVLDYYPRFLSAFPDVASLADASLDDVLSLWSGLGYYSRARNLHRCAVEVVNLHQGAFPSSAQLLQTLPGIGRSTAAAVASLCFSERVAILDGNVKRVLTRVLGFDADLASTANERRLWDEATALLPTADLHVAMARYTQGVMDLGATTCTPKKPKCERCPVAAGCVAFNAGQPERFPVKTRKLKRSAQSIWLLQAQTPKGDVLLSKRPTPGVWAGLYCFPLFDSRADLARGLSKDGVDALIDFPAFVHVLTHKDLHLHVVKWPVAACDDVGLDGVVWFAAGDWPQLGLPAPIRKWLQA